MREYDQGAGRAGLDGRPATCTIREQEWHSVLEAEQFHLFTVYGSWDKARQALTRQLPGTVGLGRQKIPSEVIEPWLQMLDLCVRLECRRGRMLAHFGETPSPGHGRPCCDVCSNSSLLRRINVKAQVLVVVERMRSLPPGELVSVEQMAEELEPHMAAGDDESAIRLVQCLLVSGVLGLFAMVNESSRRRGVRVFLEVCD